MAPDSNEPLPPGLLAVGDPDSVAAAFAHVALLQPVAVVADGVACAPRAAPDLARRGMEGCPLELRPLARPPGWPDPPSMVAGDWYLRSPDHIPAPAGYRELVQVPGEGFGAWPHPTTLMCVEAIAGLDDGRALDLGCGSGLLTQAWAALRGPVAAVDLDPRAVAHTRASLRRARPRHPVTLWRASFAGVLPASTAPTLLANVPPVAHAEIVAALQASANTVLVSGVRADDGPAVVDSYGAHGFIPTREAHRDGWGMWVLRR
jgi:hypothetical protein